MARVLVVDDDPDTLRTLRRALQRFGHEVGEAAEGRAALATLDREEWSLVITDVNMPGMDGIELIQAMMERRPEVPVIAISGGGWLPKEHLLADAGLMGAVTTLVKPVDLADLRRAVDSALSPGAAG